MSDLKNEIRELYKEYKEEIDKQGLWTYESFENFLRWSITGNITN